MLKSSKIQSLSYSKPSYASYQSKIKVLNAAYNTLHHLHPLLPLWPHLLPLRCSFIALQSHLFPCCSLKMYDVFCLRAFPLALPGIFFLKLLNDLFLHLLQVSVLTLKTKKQNKTKAFPGQPYLFTLFSISFHIADNFLAYCVLICLLFVKM